jgi:tetratricopeptide (TPR) repeat protein
LDAFPSGRVILLLDNFETLVDPESLSLRDSELSEALNALLGGQHHAVKVVITTRIAPRDLAISEPGRQHHLSLDEGLESPYAENVLREMDADGRVGLKSAPAELLNRARAKTRGFPRALEALYAILSVDRYTTLEELLEISLPDEVVQKLVGEAFNRLDPSAQKVMQALAVYNRPVSPAAIDYLLQPHLPSIDSALVLNRLVNMHFARREAGRYYLHPADREYAISTISRGDEIKDENPEQTKMYRQLGINPPHQERTDFTQIGLTDRAADYFAEARKPRAKWKKLDDLAAQLAEFDLRCDAGDYDTAASVLLEIDGEYLLVWGHYRLMIDLHEKVQGKISDKGLTRRNIGNLGQALEAIGKVIQALSSYEKALTMAKAEKNRQAEEVWLGNLGGAHFLLGNTRRAVEYYEQQLIIAREVGNRRDEGNGLTGLGIAYAELGDTAQAIKSYEQAFSIYHDIGYPKGESMALGNLGISYADLGNASKAIELYEKALLLKREINDRNGEAIFLENTGHTFLSIETYQKAEENYRQAIHIADEILIPVVQLSARCGLAQVYLFQNDLVNARATIEAALQYDVPQNNHNATALRGIVALRQGERETAQEAFAKSIVQADEILAKTPDYYSALDAKGLALCGLILVKDLTGLGDLLGLAIETFRKARKIAPHAGVVKSVLRLFDELVKCDEQGTLKDVRKAAEGV